MDPRQLLRSLSALCWWVVSWLDWANVRRRTPAALRVTHLINDPLYLVVGQVVVLDEGCVQSGPLAFVPLQDLWNAGHIVG